MAEQGPPEYLTVLKHIFDIDNCIQPADLPSFSSELLQAGLITDATHRDAIATTGLGPGIKIASLTAAAMTTIKATPELFNKFIIVLETRDEQLASTLRYECRNKWHGELSNKILGINPVNLVA